MIDFAVIEVAEPKPETFNLFKQYASVPDSSRDALLRSLLKTAMAQVQNISNKSMLPSTLRVTATRREANDPVRLYQNASSIVSVKDGDGADIGYTLDGAFVTPDEYTYTLAITYKTEPDLGTAMALQSIAFKLATAYYDGEDSEVCNKILQEAATC